ncbi:MAG: phosphatidate cytidylyltransferase [Myxococcales bacterium]
MSKPSNLAVRVATAVVAVPAILALLYIAPPWGFFVLAFAASIAGATEFFAMTHPAPSPRSGRVLGVALTAAVSLLVYFFGADARVLLTLVVALAVAAPLLGLLGPGNLETAALRVCALGFGPLFVGVPLTLLAVMLRDRAPNGGHYVVLAMGFAWLSDTGGYFAGRAFGKHKLYELVSPKKTVEGALGGLVAVALWGVFGSVWLIPSLPLPHAIGLAVVAGALGQAGDPGESLLKRSTGIKDSGVLVPGHGGLLDRVDALLVTSSIVYLYTLWIGGR